MQQVAHPNEKWVGKSNIMLFLSLDEILIVKITFFLIMKNNANKYIIVIFDMENLVW